MEENTYYQVKSSLISKNIKVSEKRTSVRLEPEMWCELKNIAKRETCTIHDICSLIAMRKDEKTSLTAAIRVFLMLYYRAAATENGHDRAGHGSFMNMKRRAGMEQNWSSNSKKVVNGRAHAAADNDDKLLSEDGMSSRLAPHLGKKEKNQNEDGRI